MATAANKSTAKNNADWKPNAKFPYAVIRTGSKQYCVSEGDMILVEKLDVQPGDVWTAEDVLFVAKDAGQVEIGKPQVSGAKVDFEVLQQTLDKKVLVRHSRRRKNSKNTRGHRQAQTRLLVKSIKA